MKRLSGLLALSTSLLIPLLSGAASPLNPSPNRNQPANEVMVSPAISSDAHQSSQRSAVPRVHQHLKSHPLATFDFYGKCDSAAIFDLKKGAAVPMHKHSNRQISYIVRGAVKVTANKKDYILRAGQVIVLPPNVPHRFVALEDTTEADFFTTK